MDAAAAALEATPEELTAVRAFEEKMYEMKSQQRNAATPDEAKEYEKEVGNMIKEFSSTQPRLGMIFMDRLFAAAFAPAEGGKRKKTKKQTRRRVKSFRKHSKK